MYKIQTFFFLLSLSFSIAICGSRGSQIENVLDVLSYHLTIEPDIPRRFIEGSVRIVFDIAVEANSIALHCGDLEIDTVTGEDVRSYRKEGHILRVLLSAREGRNNEITVKYHGNPLSGLFFDLELDHAYTVFSTRQWMVCHDIPGDKATFDLNILIPKGKKCVASGAQIGIEERSQDKMLFHWSQNYESPTYTYGFAIGDFKEESEMQGNVQLKYYSQSLKSDQLREVFKETGSIIRFFELRSGVRYVQSTYSQILMGDHYQEMSGFSVLKDSYGILVLKDSTETNLISHELAHQWWGNQITCKSWNHFWLNEALATYMSAAYNEYRFGNEKYNSDIRSYLEVYQAIKLRGNDKSLVFKDWLNPSRDDRNLVYFKGAYVIHLLRQELGDEDFWKGIKSYSQTYFGKSVRTIDFQDAMEQSCRRDLNAFFSQWVYNSVNKN